MDETGFLMLPTVTRTWGLRGKTPLLKHRMNHWSKVSAIGALTISPRRRRLGLYLNLYPNANISQEEAIGFLRALLRHLRGPILLIRDRWQVHRGRRMREFLEAHRRIRVEPLPPYAPDLNPVDKGWAWMKLHRLANHGLTQLDELADAVGRTYEEARSEQRLLRSLVQATGLPIRL